MPASDALVVVNDWISEYYFTADENSGTFFAETKKLVKGWREESEAQPEWHSPLERFTSERQHLISRLIEVHTLAGETPPARAPGHTAASRDAAVMDRARVRDALAAPSTAVADLLRDVLGYSSAPATRYGALRLYTPVDTPEPTVALIDAVAAETPEDLFSATGGLLTEDVVLPQDPAHGAPADRPATIPATADTTTVEGAPADRTAAEQSPVDALHPPADASEKPLSTVSALLSALVGLDPAPQYMLILAGRTAVLTSNDGWPQGRYLAIDVQTIADRGDTKSGGEIQRMLACLSADSVAPDATGTIWWNERREQSTRNAVGVSKDLRDGVRESIEILANEVVARRKAQGLPPLPDDQAQTLAIQCLRYLYRILFLLYAETSPELGVVPVGAPEYETGYSMDRLRELTLKQLTSRSESGTHLYESLRVLFTLVETGHDAPSSGQDPDRRENSGLTFEALRSDLFSPHRTALIDEVRLGNKALQAVLRHLLLTKEKRGKDRGFISYVALGINQLGAVYESLMSYTGSFAHGTLLELAKNGDPSDGSWVVPEERVDDELRQHLVMVEDDLGREFPRTYHHGEFVFRLSGRQRQQSASYYSPEILTQFTVQQGLEELLQDDPPAEEILRMTVCEPALGSGAFAIEAVRQLAAAYLTKRQTELGQKIPPEDYQAELQKTKAYIALHNVYGVDLNPTAVELAEVSLWLDTMSRGLKAPWFGLRLRSGNSLVGARHAVYDRSVVAKATSKVRMTTTPRHVPLGRSVTGTDGIFHFLLPAEGWGAAGSNTEIKKVAPDQAKELRDWAKRVVKKPSNTQLKELVSLSERIDELWQLARRRMVEAENQSRRSISVWGAETPEGGSVTREKIEDSLRNSNSSYRRLRLIMDAWCALWFWPVTLQGDQPAPPEFEDWLATIRRITGYSLTERTPRGKRRAGRQAEDFFAHDTEWFELDNLESWFSAQDAADVDRLLEETPWLREVQRIATEQRFFHWELDFAAVFVRGCFDFQVGNPPWVRPTLDVPAMLGEKDPWWMLAEKPAEATKKHRRRWTLELPQAAETLLAGAGDTAGIAAFVKSPSMYPELAGTQPDLYRVFMAQTWRHASERGHTSLIHPPTHLTDARGYTLRKHTYRHLRRHWNFLNECQLFEEIHHLVSYSVNVYGPEREPLFRNAVSMYHPSTVTGSLVHNGDGPEPGFRDQDGNWDMRPHRARIQTVDRAVLSTWHALMESGSAEIPVDETRMVYAVNRSADTVLERLSTLPPLSAQKPFFSSGWHETGGRRDGYFESLWGEAESWGDVILQGPYFHVGTPFSASRNATMKGNQDYSAVDLETLASDALPVTEYKPIYDTDEDGSLSTVRYDRDYGSWTIPHPHSPGETFSTPVRDHFRVMWRAMAATTGERTLISAIFPPGTGTIHRVNANGYPFEDSRKIPLEAASLSSLISDFMIRSTVTSDIFQSAIDRLPLIPSGHPLAPAAILRILRLNCLTEAYAPLWDECWDPVMSGDAWTGGRERANRPELGGVGPRWTDDTPLRMDEDRRRALVEIDAIMAHVTGVSIDELCTIYRTQFGVLSAYERGEDKRAKIYDDDGRLIPSSVRTAWNAANRPERGLSIDDRTYVNPSGRQITAPEPFLILDRERDMREAYAEFARRMERAETAWEPVAGVRPPSLEEPLEQVVRP